MGSRMMCEPNTSLPQKIDLESMRREIKPRNEKEVDDENIRPKISYSQDQYDILPKFSDQFEHVKSTLSLVQNPYLAGRWNQFLGNVPEKYITVRLYKDFMNLTKNRTVPRPKTLNGEFYGTDNQLAPIPSNSDQMKKERQRLSKLGAGRGINQ